MKANKLFWALVSVFAVFALSSCEPKDPTNPDGPEVVVPDDDEEEEEEEEPELPVIGGNLDTTSTATASVLYTAAPTVNASVEQQQQKRISSLKPINESILETTFFNFSNFCNYNAHIVLSVRVSFRLGENKLRVFL